MRDKVSIIIAIYNEEKTIGRTITSLLNQQCENFDLEILAIDGNSTDGTSTIIKNIAEKNRYVKYLINPHRKTPFAFNIGLEEAEGDYIAILGAHAEYESNYLSTCLEEMTLYNAVGCSGQVISKAIEANFESNIILNIYNSSFGVSSQSFRTLRQGYVDSLPYPVFQKDVILSMGGYNTRLFRNQDNDLNQRLREQGHLLYYTHKTSCNYYPKSTVKGMRKYAFTNGLWNAFSLRENSKSMSIHHLVPFLFTCYIILALPLLFLVFNAEHSTVLSGLILSPLVLYIGIAIYIAIRSMIKEKLVSLLLLPWYFFQFHFAYGLGTLRGFFKSSDRFQEM